LRVQLCVVAESWDSEGAPDFQHYRGVEGCARSPGIRLGRGTRRSSLNLHPKQTTKWLVHIRGVQLCVVAESWHSEGVLDFQHYRGVEGRARSPGIRLGRGTRRSSLNLHPKQTTKWLVHIREHPWVLGQATSTLTHKTHHGADSGEATTFPHIVFSATLRGGYIQMALFLETPKLESRNCPEIVPVRVPGL
jgi:hypothetical protein